MAGDTGLLHVALAKHTHPHTFVKRTTLTPHISNPCILMGCAEPQIRSHIVELVPIIVIHHNGSEWVGYKIPCHYTAIVVSIAFSLRVAAMFVSVWVVLASSLYAC